MNESISVDPDLSLIMSPKDKIQTTRLLRVRCSWVSPGVFRFQWLHSTRLTINVTQQVSCYFLLESMSVFVPQRCCVAEVTVRPSPKIFPHAMTCSTTDRPSLTWCKAQLTGSFWQASLTQTGLKIEDNERSSTTRWPLGKKIADLWPIQFPCTEEKKNYSLPAQVLHTFPRTSGMQTEINLRQK